MRITEYEWRKLKMWQQRLLLSGGFMHIITTAKVTSDKKIVIDEKYQQFLKPVMKLNLVIDHQDNKIDKKKHSNLF